MSGRDVPIFSGTEDALNYGRHLRRVILERDDFQTLVRTWLVSQRAVANAVNDQAKVILATRCQLLREAVEAFLFPNELGLTSTTGHRAQGDPATGSDDEAGVPSET